MQLVDFNKASFPFSLFARRLMFRIEMRLDRVDVAEALPQKWDPVLINCLHHLDLRSTA